ncbi:MAG: single-stranded DNA-binding protein [Bacteroidales bacterium]|nr:single-stranded DNA-binding protein [Bacteroidales bacterium]
MTTYATSLTQQRTEDRTMLNHVELLGRLAQEPETRYTQTGTPVASFDLAVQVPSRDKNTPPDYIPIVCWDKQAEFVNQYLTKGRQIVVEGRITTRKWQGNDGKNHKAVEVTASRIYFADSNGGGGNGNNYQGNGFMD